MRHNLGESFRFCLPYPHLQKRGRSDCFSGPFSVPFSDKELDKTVFTALLVFQPAEKPLQKWISTHLTSTDDQRHQTCLPTISAPKEVAPYPPV